MVPLFAAQEQKPFSWAQRAAAHQRSAPKPAPQQPPAGAAPSRQPPAPRPLPNNTDNKPGSSGQSPDAKPLPPRESREQRPPRRAPDAAAAATGGAANERDRDSSRSGAGEPDDFRRRPGPEFSRLPDSHQLFVGNLPHTVSDKDLKEQFEGVSLHGAAAALSLVHIDSRSFHYFLLSTVVL